jgi:cellulose synthase/poly-beta-1,6-N-acetylglucosamine synthase-like glycosyltransferase
MNLIGILSAIVLAYLAFGALYQLLFALAGHFFREPARQAAAVWRSIAVFIPAYREDAVILEVARQALAQDYPAERYAVIVIADGLQPDTLAALKGMPILLIEVAFERSTKAKALNKALGQIGSSAYDIALILDADNVMESSFLQRVNALFASGCRVLQGQRAAKNADTPMAVIDGASEAINNHILCKGARAMGLSARLAGSAMAFDYPLFCQVMPQIDAIGGFDKELELLLTQRGERIYYSHEAIVYDEKVRRGSDFSRQRSRWIAAQFHYAQLFFPVAVQHCLRTGKVDFFHKALQLLLPPRLIAPGLLAIGALLHALWGPPALAIAWLLTLLASVLSFLLAMPTYMWRAPYRNALLRLPVAFFYALLSLTKLRQARQRFIHTPHGEKPP